MGMGQRGVSRPMALHSGSHGGHGSHPDDEKNSAAGESQGHDTHESAEQDGGHEQGMSEQQRHEMLQMHHQHTLWIYWTLVVLGAWLIVAPFSLGYLNERLWVDPSGGRGVWFSEETHTALRAWLMAGSDVLCGLALVFFGWRSLRPNRPYSLWAACGVGVWLTMAPVLFWAPTAVSYLNDTLIGAWVIALTILIPGMPNMIMYMQMGPATPAGWSYNPSSWPQRWIMIATGLLGWIVSRYLTMFQLGYIDYVWDPFFGFVQGTRSVLNSRMSHMWPISDAGLGSIAYTFEFLMGYMGSPARWRTMPWMVAFFGILVIPLGLTHILLVISQPVIVHAWCTFCLLAAAIMLPMIPLEVDEVVAMVQHVVRARRRGDRGGSLWRIFWKGGSAEDSQRDERSPQLATMGERPGPVLAASLWGLSYPWTLLAASLLGVLVMFLPTWFGLAIETRAADVAHLCGALVVTVSVVCLGEVVRLGRYLNVLLALALGIAPWMTQEAAVGYSVACGVAALLIALLSLPRGPQREHYGTWDRYVR